MTTSKELRLKNLLALVGEFKTADAVARMAGTAPMYLSQIINGTKSSTGKPRGVGDALARKLEIGCGKEIGWLDKNHDPDTSNYAELSKLSGISRVVIAEDDDPDFYQIPKVKLELQAGLTGFQTIPDIYDGSKLSVAKNWVDRRGLHPAALIAVSVKGQSMEPNLYEGDQVIVNTADTRMQDGAVFAVNYEGEAVIKRLARDQGDWWLTSDNADQQKYSRKRCRNGECIIVGRVVRRETDHL